MKAPLCCPDYISVSERARSVDVSFKTSTRGEIAHLVIDSTGLKVIGVVSEKSKNMATCAVVSGENCIWLLM